MTDAPRVGGKALKPNAALRRLSFLVGDWITEGTHSLVPGTPLPGRTTFSWHEGGAFLIMHSQVDHPAFPDGVAIFASDDGLEQLTMCWFDERGVSRFYAVEAGERQLSWRRDSPEISQTNTIAAEGENRLRGVGRIAEEGGGWSDDLSVVYHRAPA